MMTQPPPKTKNNHDDNQRISLSPFATLEIYSDGGYFEKQDIGGWGWIIFQDQKECQRLSDWKQNTSSLEMELTAASSALHYLNQRLSEHSTMAKSHYKIKLYTDSRILIDGLHHKIQRWRAQNWQHKSGRKVDFQPLWETLESLSQQYDVKWHWVKSHNGNLGNTIADELARKAVINRSV